MFRLGHNKNEFGMYYLILALQFLAFYIIWFYLDQVIPHPELGERRKFWCIFTKRFWIDALFVGDMSNSSVRNFYSFFQSISCGQSGRRKVVGIVSELFMGLMFSNKVSVFRKAIEFPTDRILFSKNYPKFLLNILLRSWTTS